MKALEEFGKALLSLANMLTVLSFINVYLQKDEINSYILVAFIYTIIALYSGGYYFIKRSEKDE